LSLTLPPGRAGVVPDLSLVYDSSAGDGVLGMGFSLTGISSITRCPKNLAQDGEVSAITLTSTDNLCLDGRRLKKVAEWPGFEEFRTFPDSLSKIVASFPNGWSSAAGPQSFRIFTREGLILDYGTTSDSRTTATNGVVRT